MKTNEAQKWIQAGILISKDFNASVRCPKCDRAILEVHDVPYEPDPKVFERYMTCHACGARNILRMKRDAGDEQQLTPKVTKTGRA